MRTPLFGLILSLLAGPAFAAAPAIALVPLPQQMQVRTGLFTLCSSQPILGTPAFALTKILVDTNSQENGEYLAQLLLKSTGYKFQIVSNSGVSTVKRAILLTTANANATLGPEGYELTVAPDSVVIRGNAAAGVFYGIQSLLQLFPPQIFGQRPAQGVAWTAPCVYIQDWPRFSWRGWMLDPVRHFFTKDEVKQLLDGLALNKLNMFHMHLDDDSGWRIEILKYPLLTQSSAWRTNIMFGLNPRSSTAWNDIGLYGGYYSQQDIREIVAYASQRHITIVPEIEMPGHSTAALSAYPQFSCNGTNNDCTNCLNVPYSLSVTAYSGGVFCIARPETTNFLHDVLTEVMGLFPGPYIHIGGDEVIFGNWNKHSLDQAMTNSMGLVYDRSQEHLGTSDTMIIRTRRRLINAAQAIAETGVTPMTVDHPEWYRIRSGSTLLPVNADWFQATEKLRTAFVEHRELDSALTGGA
jgi:hexosaminidase